MLEAAAFALWTAFPEPASFAAGLVVWGVAGALMSGAAEALVYDGLAAPARAAATSAVRGRMRAAELLVQVPTALAAAGLFALGGYPLVGWVSVGCCLGAAALALRFPGAPRTGRRRGRTERFGPRSSTPCAAPHCGSPCSPSA